MKKYVYEVEKIISNSKEKNLIYKSEMKKNINEINNGKIDKLDINTSQYSNYLLDYLKNMILNMIRNYEKYIINNLFICCEHTLSIIFSRFIFYRKEEFKY